MRKLAHSLTVCLLLTGSLFNAFVPAGASDGPRQAAPGGDSDQRKALPRYQLGARSVVIPAPNGFSDALDAGKGLEPLLKAVNASSLELLVMHVPTDDLASLRRDPSPMPGSFTMVSVYSATKDTDVTLNAFQQITASIERLSNAVFDPKAPELKAALERASKKLSVIYGEQIDLKITQGIHLGVVEKRDDRFLFMLLMKLRLSPSDSQDDAPVLCAAAMLRINQRLVLAFTVRESHSAEDAAALRDFAQQWIGQIIAANPT